MTAPGAEWPPPKPGPAPPDVRRFYRRTALACLAAFAVSLLCVYWGASVLPPLSLSFLGLSQQTVEPFSERFWAYAAFAAAPLAAFAAAWLYCRLRARSCSDAPRAKRAAVRAPLACAAAWYAIPVIAAMLSFPQDVGAWLEFVVAWVFFLWYFLTSFTIIPLAAIAALGVLVLASSGDPEPEPRRVARRSASACLAALAFLLAFSFARPALQPSLPNLQTSELPPLGPGDWALLVGVPLAAFAAAGAYGWLQARSCGGGRRAKAVAVLVPLASAAAWLALPAAFWLFLGMEAGDSPAVYLLWSVDLWTRVPLSWLYLALLSCVLFAVWARMRVADDS